MNIRPTQDEAEAAIRTILRFIGEDPSREGLVETPMRVVKNYLEMFMGYSQNIEDIASKKFYDIGNFQDFILLKEIKFNSFCEHHILPFNGHVDIAYIPNDCVIGISKLARIVQIFAKRLQIQEKMTFQIAETLQQHLAPLGVAVKISASHSCMTMRGVMQPGSLMETMHYTGVFTEQQKYRSEFLNLISRK